MRDNKEGHRTSQQNSQLMLEEAIECEREVVGAVQVSLKVERASGIQKKSCHVFEILFS